MGEAISLFFFVVFAFFQVYGVGGSYFILFRALLLVGGGLFGGIIGAKRNWQDTAWTTFEVLEDHRILGMG